MNPDGALSVLSAMITPAVLISAGGTLILSTSQRLGRTTDRVRSLTGRFKQLIGEGRLEPLAREEKRMIISQIPRLTRRVRLLQRALTSFYGAVAVFVLTSLVIGGGEVLGRGAASAPTLLGLLGAVALAYGSTLLIFEAQLSYRTTRREMDFLQQLGDHYAELYKQEREPDRS
ncbi:DUF2721 domain-containing protein [Deinococcus maricopensis]|uniref:DUF2721 domain-containing protein n=1 Tax=Deinococcus maricopensis (strain DSM 21211 / LMG 22137 / NRRL B-23946 / LB-34) TaxID=709986 RepID=E8U5Y5_DEIML|nr:DUF2721 domain-containing protein [Deinococcus maricopensis]ADV66474.1 hypothetical protein Deima_0819 [Deinococcus maricopensis DSM 21211]